MVSYITTTLVLVVLGVLTLCASAQGCTDEWDHIIYVDHTATDTPTCGNITHRCNTFNTALNKLTHNSTAICLYPGTYNLTYGSHTQLLYKSNIAIIGSSEDTVTVQCSPLSGLSFNRSSNITLKSLTLRKCGSEKFSINRLLGMVRFQVSVYMLYCENVLMDTVTIESSNGTGLTLYNTVGTVTIQYCVFKHNGVLLDKSNAGGGGLQIEFTYCTPNVDSSCKESDPYYSSNYAQYNIISSVFTGNIATYAQNIADNVLLGRGGGISIILLGHSSKNIFDLSDINITSNTAHQGGGIYLALHDDAQNNSISFNNINILNNKADAAIDSACDAAFMGGGAIYIELKGFFVYTNNILISKTIIEHNEAIFGGGILLLADSDFSLVISNSTFHCNSAQHGAAMYLYSFIDDTLGLLVSDTNFTNNVAAHAVMEISSLLQLACLSVICADRLSFDFTGTIMLTNNYASAIELHHANLALHCSSNCTFDGNTGDKGGAIALYNCSTIILHDNVQLVFNNNSASIGGAIYSGECSLPVCFIQYYQAHVNPNVQLYFSNNTASRYGNAMYISNVVSCWPPNVTCYSITENVEIIKQTFCWNNTWHYSPGDCYSNVDTSILYYTSPLPSYSIYPGDELHPDLNFYNGQMQALNNELVLDTFSYKLCISGPASYYDYYCYYEFEQCSCCKDVKSNEILNLYFNNSMQHCIGDNTKIHLYFTFTTVTQCNSSSSTVSNFTFKSCPSGEIGPFCNMMSQPQDLFKCQKPAPASCPNYDDDCPHLPRHLVHDLNISYSCLEGVGIPINYVFTFCANNYSESCSNLDTHIGSWYIIILTEFIPLTIMIVSIIVLDIKLVGGHITGHILYCQIISLPFSGTFNLGQYYTDPLISMWNLNFLNPFLSFKLCISNHVSGLEVIIFWYIVAFYPLVLLLLLYIWIIMYERGWRIVVCITQPVHRLLARFWLKFDIHPSLIDSIAGIYILCFTQIAATSVKVLQFSYTGTSLTFYYDESLAYFGWPHGLAGGIAIIILIVFVIIPTVYLLFYPFKLFQKFLEVCKLRTQLTDAVIDSLTGSFKNGLENTYDYRSFAGLYLLLRIIIICLHLMDLGHAFCIQLTTHYGVVVPSDDYFMVFPLIIPPTFAGLLTLVGGAIVIFRPFRKNVHNFSNFVLLFLLLNVYEILLAIRGFLLIDCIVTMMSPDSITYISESILLVLIVIGYCAYMIIKKSGIACGFIPRTKNASANNDEQRIHIDPSLNDDFEADRVVNPDNYEERHFSNPWLETSRSTSNKKQFQSVTPDGTGGIASHQAIADDHDDSDDVDEGTALLMRV